MAAWLNGTLLDGWLGLYARWHTWNMDQDRDEASQSEWGAGAYFDGAQVLDAPFKWRLYAGWASRSYENEAGIAPGVDSAGDTGAFTVMLEVGGQVTHQFDDSRAQ